LDVLDSNDWVKTRFSHARWMHWRIKH
jgi:hypothetical protein